MKLLAHFIANGWPRHNSCVPQSVGEYYRERGSLSVTDGVNVYKRQIVVPPKMRDDTLRRLHESHQGISKCRERTANVVWWPGVSRDIKMFIDRCDTCRRNRPTQREQPLRPVELPGRPWEKIAMDIFQYKRKDYLVIIEYYSRWIEIKQLTSLTSDCLITRLKAVFTTHGIPDVVISDNGRQFVSDEFRKFAKSWCFIQQTTNPYSPQENGMAERDVQTAKRLLDLDDPEIGLLNYHASPHSAINVSPAVALMGRQLATRLPVVRQQLSPRRHRDVDIRNSDRYAKTAYKRYYDRRHGVRKLPPLQNGDPELMKLDGEKQWSTPSTVVKSDLQNQSYVVETGAGIRYRLNRRHLQGVPHIVPPEPDDEPDDTDVPADPGDAVVPPVDVSAGPNTPLVYTRSGRAARKILMTLICFVGTGEMS